MRRVAQMSRDELVTRSRQEFGKRADRMLARFGHDFSEAPRAGPSAAQFFFGADEVANILTLLQQRLPQECQRIVDRAERICAHRFDLLGYENLDYGKEIDWHLDRVHGKRAPRKPFYKIRYLDFRECGDVKVTWELNRHQHFLTLAKAYRITGERRFADEIFVQWEHWIQHNPYPDGVNWASSLEVGFRSLSWLWTYYLLGDSAQPTTFRDRLLRQLSVHGRCLERYLSTYFSPNTHLLGEGVALFFLGVLCPELTSAERWKSVGWKITLQEAQRQVRFDGLHFEQSLYYHVYALDFFLHARILAARNGISIPEEYDATIERMLNALSVLGRTGTVPRIGDDDGGRLFDGQRNRAEHMLDPLATGAVLYERGDFKLLAGGLREETLWLLGEEGARKFDKLTEPQPPASSTAFPQSGLYVMNSAERQIVIDAGPLGAGSGGHGHADALSICVSDANGPVLVDSGTFEYVGDDHERAQFRSAPAHNLLTVDGVGQPQPRGPFAWSHHPHTHTENWITGENFDFFSGTHVADRQSNPSFIQQRFVFSLKSGLWFVRDVVAGSGEHKLDAYWHFAPEFSSSGERQFVHRSGQRLDVITPEDNGWTRQVEAGLVSPVYGLAFPAPVLHFSTVASLPAEFVTLFKATAGHGDVVLRVAVAGPSVWGYSYTQPGEEHQIIFAAQPWTFGEWASDAEFLYWGYDRNRDRGLLVFFGATQVSFAGQALVELSKRQSHGEVVWENGQGRVAGSGGASVTLREDVFRTLMSASPIAVTLNHTKL